MNTKEELDNFRQTIEDWTTPDKINQSDASEVVEIGTLLTAMSVALSKRLNLVKVNLRERAKKGLSGFPGTQTFRGTSDGHQAVVTVWEDKLELGENAAPEVLEKVLGDRFELYFTRAVKYALRKNARELIMKVADEKEKSLLLSSVDNKPVTPRVSFTKI
jgi:hypothetical protein